MRQSAQIKDIREFVQKKKGERDKVLADIKKYESRKAELNNAIEDTFKAQAIIQEVAKKTQEQLEYHISNLVSLALKAVFDDPYKLKVDFEIKRGKTECNLYFEKNGELFSPLEDVGGGVVDIASFALRVSLWSLMAPRSRNTLIFDEPFRFVSKGLLPSVADMLRLISKDLGLQIIMVTHIEDLIQAGERVFEVKNDDGMSVLTVDGVEQTQRRRRRKNGKK